MISINTFTESTPEVPFGGVKDSGYGREVAEFGPRSFADAKTAGSPESSGGGGVEEPALFVSSLRWALSARP
jgi:succinate-semialdehyde dehydrogenase/glutarate-semialdehyde dehydrogenase